MRRNISDLWGLQNQWEKINACKTSLGQYWADFNCDFIRVAVSQMMNGGGLTFHSAEHQRESLIWQLSVCPLGFIVSPSLYLVSYSGLLLLSPSLPLFFFFFFSSSSLHFICTVQLLYRLNWDSSFFPSLSTYLCFMTRTKSILCCHWFFSPSSPYYPLA